MLALPVAVSLAAIAAAGATQGEPGDPSRDAAAAPAPLVADVEAPHRAPATTTTTPPPPPSTIAPEPPPTEPPAPAPVAVRRSVTAAAPAPPPQPAPAPAPAPAPPPPSAAHDSGAEARALQLINDERAGAGLPALRANGAAAGVARSWSEHMAATSLAHNPNLGRDLDNAGVAWSTCGENVGHAADVDRVHALFMGSGSHRANILSSAFTQVGVGVVDTGGHVWVTLDFVDG